MERREERRKGVRRDCVCCKCHTCQQNPEKGASDRLELGLEAVMSYLFWALEIELGYSRRTANAINA